MPRKRSYAQRVKILTYVKVGEKWRFANVVEKASNVVHDHVLIAGRDEHHPEGTYYIEWYEVGNRRRRNAVPNFAELVEQARKKAIEIEAIRAGVMEFPTAPAAPPVTATPVRTREPRLAVGAAIDKYLEFVENHRSRRTYLTYRYTLDRLFRESCTTQDVDDCLARRHSGIRDALL